MQSTATTPQAYIDSLPQERKEPMQQLREVILKNLPEGFTEVMMYGMLGYVIPHSLYPPGYHVDPKLPLSFMGIASQKNFIALYHMGLYGDPSLLSWFKEEYANASKSKLDMGKSCIRFKKPNDIPLKLIGELASRITPQDYIRMYEKNIKR